MTRYCGYSADTGGGDVDNDNGRHDRGARVAVGDIEEDLDEWIACRRVNNVKYATESEAEGDDHNETESPINGSSPHDGSWKDDGRILDFLGHFGQVSIALLL